MRILIDADGCPITKDAVELARQFSLECISVCDESRNYDIEGAVTLRVATGNNSADYAIVNIVRPDDIVLTGDIGLAAICDAKGALILDFTGKAFRSDEFGSMLTRKVMKSLHYDMGLVRKRRIRGTRKNPAVLKQQRKDLFSSRLLAILNEIYIRNEEEQRLQAEAALQEELKRREELRVQKEIKQQEELKLLEEREALEELRRQKELRRQARRNSNKKRRSQSAQRAQESDSKINEILELLSVEEQDKLEYIKKHGTKVKVIH